MNLHAVQHLLGSQSSILPLHRIEQMEVQICVYAFDGMRGLLLCPQKLYLASNGIKQGAPSSNQRSITIQIAKWTKQIIFRNTFSQCCFRGNDIASFVCFILTILNDKTGTAVQEQLSNMPILLFFLHMHKFITSIRILSPKQHHVTTQFHGGEQTSAREGEGQMTSPLNLQLLIRWFGDKNASTPRHLQNYYGRVIIWTVSRTQSPRAIHHDGQLELAGVLVVLSMSWSSCKNNGQWLHLSDKCKNDKLMAKENKNCMHL